MCLYPQLITNPKYKPNAKNGGIIPYLKDTRVLKVPIGCQECIECRKQKAREWTIRLHEDIKENKNGKFITLTFSTESLRKLNKEIGIKTENKLKGYDLDNAIAIRAVRLFLERYRKKYGKSLRHWLVTELGHQGTEHIHIHGIIWPPEGVTLNDVEDIWNYGFVWKGQTKQGKIINYVNGATVNYIVKYVNKTDEKHKNYKSQILTSAGIGKRYTTQPDARLNKYNGKETKEYYRTPQGYKLSLPIYYRNKIYTEEQREQLWLNKLDKEERHVCGERISISQGDREYYELLEYYRKKNNKLGYGGKKDWKQKEYEEQRRQLKQQLRINDGFAKNITATPGRLGVATAA